MDTYFEKMGNIKKSVKKDRAKLEVSSKSWLALVPLVVPFC